MEQKLLQNKTASQTGPVFESGPGWGAKTKKWLGRYFFKIILPVAVVILAVYAINSQKSEQNPDNLFNPPDLSRNGTVITQTVAQGDSRTLLARRALAGYLATVPGDTLSVGHKIFIENNLSQSLKGQLLKVGEEIRFEISEITRLIEESKQLTASQLEKWAGYARNIKF